MAELRKFVLDELDLARNSASPEVAFRHLERAHILSQYSTRDHVVVHWAMLGWAIRQRDLREGMGQLIRIIGAATKTAIGWIPTGNTGGANVSAFKPMPVPRDLAALIAAHRR